MMISVEEVEWMARDLGHSYNRERMKKVAAAAVTCVKIYIQRDKEIERELTHLMNVMGHHHLQKVFYFLQQVSQVHTLVWYL
jgi:hypothetical protein